VGGAVADRFRLIAGHFVAGVEQAQSVVRPLDERAQANEAKRVVAHDGAVGRATEQVRTLLDPLTESAHAITAEALIGDPADLQPGGVDVLPHVGGDPPAHRMGTGPRRTEAAVDARRVGGVEGEEMQQSLGMQFAVAFQVIIQGAGDHQRHRQFVQTVATAVLRHQRQRIADIEHAGEVFRPLQVTRHPVQIRGSST